MTAPPPQGPNHFTPPPAEPVSKSSARRNLLIAGILAGGGCLLVVIVVIGLLVAFVLRGGSSGSSGADGSSEGSATPEEQATALATEYTDALVAGDAEAALAAFGEDGITGAALLPTEAYTTALESAPVADVEIGTPVIDDTPPITATVELSYTVGGEPVTTELQMDDFDEDDRLALTRQGPNTTAPASAKTLAMTLNGAEVSDEQEVFLLPGGYELALGDERFAPESTDPLSVADLDGLDGWPELELTEDGQKAFRAAVQDAVDDCIADKDLVGGCGSDRISPKSSDGWTAEDGTVNRTLSKKNQKAVDEMTGTPLASDPTTVEGSGPVGAIATTLKCSKDGQTGSCEMTSGSDITVPRVDMADP